MPRNRRRQRLTQRVSGRQRSPATLQSFLGRASLGASGRNNQVKSILWHGHDREHCQQAQHVGMPHSIFELLRRLKRLCSANTRSSPHTCQQRAASAESVLTVVCCRQAPSVGIRQDASSVTQDTYPPGTITPTFRRTSMPHELCQAVHAVPVRI